MTGYAPVGQLTGTFSRRISLTDRLPWIYTIACMSTRVLCVRESNGETGLLGEIAAQIGNSSLSFLSNQAASLGLEQPTGPYVIVAARLPFGNDPAGFDGASASVRAQCAATLQAKIATHFIPSKPGWTDMSSTESAPAGVGSAIELACDTIFRHTQAAISGMTALARSVPLHVVLLDPYPLAAHETESIESVVSEIEIEVHRWLISTVKATYGADWWGRAIPLQVRQGCSARREEEGGDHSIAPDAYMMLIDLMAVAKSNWQLTGPFMEMVARKQGKEAGTNWIYELNQIRKVLAHPIKSIYVPLPAGSYEWVLDLRRRILGACATFPAKAGDSSVGAGTS